QCVPHPIPLSGRRGAALLRFRLPAPEHAFQTPRVLSGPSRTRDLLAEQRPKTPRMAVALLGAGALANAAVERKGVIPAGAVAPRCNPVGVRQRLEMAADGRLRKLEDGAQLP